MVVQKLLCRVPPGVYDLFSPPLPCPPLFPLHFLTSVTQTRRFHPYQTRQRSVHEWNSASNRNAPPCTSPSLPPSLPGKKAGDGEPKFSRISRLHRAAITFLPLARTSFYIDSIRCVYREQKRVERTSETWSNLLSRSFGWILDGSGEDEKRNIFPFFSIYLRHARGSYTLIN